MKHEKLIEIANDLSNNDLCMLINIVAERLNVFIGSTDKIQLTGELSMENPACLNGASVQINLEYTDGSRSFLDAYGEYLEEVKSVQ
tara:strand:- start:116 stop:376 length:261 start_codon:yes stop_codon:yes gene_type:complete